MFLYRFKRPGEDATTRKDPHVAVVVSQEKSIADRHMPMFSRACAAEIQAVFP